jgi:hypothetical protein
VTIVTAPAFISEGVNDGTVAETSETSNVGGAFNAAAQAFTVGDTTLRRQRRAIVSFNTAGLPDNAIITSATLKIQLSTMTTPSPFSVLGQLKADLGRPHFGQSAALESIDFQASATALGAATFSSTASAGWYSAVVGKSFLPSINRTGRTQFRLRFALDDNNDSLANYAAFFSGDAATTADRPQLIIRYYMP